MTISTRLDGARAFHPDLRTFSRVLPTAIVGRRTLPVMQSLTRRMPGRPGFVEHPLGETAAIRVHRPASAPELAPAVLWIHGGGLVIGSPHQDEPRLQRLADDLGAVIATVRYGLGPQHRFPTGVEDCYAALEWLASSPGVDPQRVAVAGASAGGGLAAAVALAARDRGGPALCFQLLVYPMLDDRTAASPDHGAALRRVWNNTANHLGWSSYLGHEPGAVGVSHLAAPARSTDLSRLPPAWIGVGTLDLFHDEDLDYAARLEAAGVPCETSVVEGAFHGFDTYERAGVSRRFLEAQTQALRRGLAATAP